jgi:hypothetical protein
MKKMVLLPYNKPLKQPDFRGLPDVLKLGSSFMKLLF